MNIWHDISPSRITAKTFEAYIEIPKGCKAKYELDKEKYADSEYAEWFSSFDDSLITKLFLDKCEAFYGEILVNEENLKKALSIRSVGTNYDY